MQGLNIILPQLLNTELNFLNFLSTQRFVPFYLEQYLEEVN